MIAMVCLRLVVAAPLVMATMAPAAKPVQEAGQPIAASTPQIDAATLAAARELVAATDIQKQLKAVIPQVIDAAMSNTTRMFKPDAIPEGLHERLTTLMRDGMTSMTDVFTPNMLDQIATIYARHFSVDELKRLTTLMRDPAMVSFRERMPVVTHDLMPVMMAAMKPKQEAFQKKLLSVITEWINEHPDDRSRLAQPIAS